MMTIAASYTAYSFLHENLEYNSAVTVNRTIQNGCDLIGNTVVSLDNLSKTGRVSELSAPSLTYGSYSIGQIDYRSPAVLDAEDTHALSLVLSQYADSSGSADYSYGNNYAVPLNDSEHACKFTSDSEKKTNLAASTYLAEVRSKANANPKIVLIRESKGSTQTITFAFLDPILLTNQRKNQLYGDINKYKSMMVPEDQVYEFFAGESLPILQTVSGNNTESELNHYSAIRFFNGTLSHIVSVDHSYLEKNPKRVAGMIFILGMLASAVGVTMSRAALIKESLISNELQQQALTDSLTSIANRRRWDDLLISEESYRARTGISYVIAVIDLDGFKEINDTYGHSEGDLVLCKLAEIISSAIRKSDTAARVGGDEFVILFKNTKQSAVSTIERSIANKIRDAGISASIGTASSHEVDRLQDLWKLADERMYHAKAKKK